MTRDDAPGDRRALLVATGTIFALVSVGAAAHSAWTHGQLEPGSVGVQFTTRALANVAGSVVDLLVLLALRPERGRGGWQRGRAVVTAGVVGAAARVAVLVNFGAHVAASPSTQATEYVIGLLGAVMGNVLGLAFLVSRQRVRQEAHAAAAGEVQYRLALAALQQEEIRVRREVAEGLHGSLQQRLVLLTARIDALADQLTAGRATPDHVTTLRDISAALNTVRESDVREISRMLYPDGLEVGLIPAVRSLLVRLPPTIATRLSVSDDVRLLDDPASPLLSQSERLLGVRVVEEGVTNALRHGAASNIEVRVRADAGALRIVVSDDGRGFDAGAHVAGSGTARLADRLALVGGWLDLRSTKGEGAVLEASLPVTASVIGVSSRTAAGPNG